MDAFLSAAPLCGAEAQAEHTALVECLRAQEGRCLPKRDRPAVSSGCSCGTVPQTIPQQKACSCGCLQDGEGPGQGAAAGQRAHNPLAGSDRRSDPGGQGGGAG